MYGGAWVVRRGDVGREGALVTASLGIIIAWRVLDGLSYVCDRWSLWVGCVYWVFVSSVSLVRGGEGTTEWGAT